MVVFPIKIPHTFNDRFLLKVFIKCKLIHFVFLFDP